MEPLITNAIDPALLRVLEKRRDTRDPAPPRKRAAAPEKPVEEQEVEEGRGKEEPGPDTPKHTFDDHA
ncbi:MAG: hypothetical protein LAO30_03260 [Acidobacteriia bacterium]|nr:hypothetical protein [Terriglobia bacterium]